MAMVMAMLRVYIALFLRKLFEWESVQMKSGWAGKLIVGMASGTWSLWFGEMRCGSERCDVIWFVMKM